MEKESLGVVFGRTWLSGHSDVLKGFELGRLGLAYLSTEKVILHTHSFFEIPYVIKQIGKKVFFDEIKNNNLQFVCQIENIAIGSLDTGASSKSTVTMIYPPELVELRSSGKVEILSSLLDYNTNNLSGTVARRWTCLTR